MPETALRKLARRYAEGGIERDDYRRQRASLVESVVTGIPLPEEVEIEAELEREDPTRTGETTTTTATVPVWQTEAVGDATLPMARPPRRGRAVPMLIGAGVLVVAVAAAVLLSGGDEPPPAPPAVAATPAAPDPLVSFIERGDWSLQAMGDLGAQWQALELTARAAIAEGPSFRRIADAIHEQLQEERSLAALDPKIQQPERQRALLDLASILALEDARIDADATVLEALAPPGQGPGLRPDAPLATLPPVATPPEALPGQAPPAAAANPPAARAPATAPTPTPAPAAAAPAGDSAWLSAQDPRAYTLQLFAVRNDDKLRELRALHPQIELRALPSADPSVRYRVVHGVFRDPEAAQAAFSRLPAALTSQSARPIVKSFGDLSAQTRAQR